MVKIQSLHCEYQYFTQPTNAMIKNKLKEVCELFLNRKSMNLRKIKTKNQSFADCIHQ